MKKFIKKHRYTLIILLVFILLVFVGTKLVNVLIPDEGKASYGNRLEDEDKYPISDDVYTKIKEELLKDKNKAIDITNRLQGKVVRFIVTVDDKLSVKDSKTLIAKIPSYFTEEQLKYYTIEVLVKKNDSALNNFPIIGIKNPTSNNLVWTLDREVTKDEK